MAENNTTDNDTGGNEDSSNEDLADLALGNAREDSSDDDDEGSEAEGEQPEGFWGSFKSYIPQAKELAELKAALSAKEQELASLLASKRLELEDMFDEETIKKYSAEDIEELAAALYFTIHPEKVDPEIAKGIKSKRESISAKRQREKDEQESRSRAEEVARAKEEADIRSYQADLRGTIADLSDELPCLMELAGGSRAKLAELVFAEVLEATEAGVASSPEDIDPKVVLAGLERRAAKALKRGSAARPQAKAPIVKGTPKSKRRGIFA